MSAQPILAGYIYPARMPWGAMVDDLNSAGCSTSRIATILGCDRATVQGWDRSEPRHSYGQALIELHAQICPALREKRRGEARARV